MSRHQKISLNTLGSGTAHAGGVMVTSVCCKGDEPGRHEGPVVMEDVEGAVSWVMEVVNSDMTWWPCKAQDVKGAASWVTKVVTSDMTWWPCKAQDVEGAVSWVAKVLSHSGQQWHDMVAVQSSAKLKPSISVCFYAINHGGLAAVHPSVEQLVEEGLRPQVVIVSPVLRPSSSASCFFTPLAHLSVRCDNVQVRLAPTCFYANVRSGRTAVWRARQVCSIQDAFHSPWSALGIQDGRTTVWFFFFFFFFFNHQGYAGHLRLMW